ncbi:MAG: aspartyl-tRNA(Asn)/glutamyl-tRNA(Gln) amidotransferase subunit [Patescibacteria group bacterium]|nr:aspartyl-tRNA(Asn)/glutamyl-tRNA(Gln) amidotransferase subunit [Patescibacteria group bacterium]
MKYNVTIGMEVHAELKTASKMFCACKNGLGLEQEPNVHICPVCTGQPGTLPVPNRQAIEMVQRIGLALNCTINRHSKFDRKNYFYPDIPKGYQISQYDEPFCEHGTILVNGKSFRITRIHLEEDTGKSLHPAGADYTLVDFNRAGVALMELVTEADFENGKDTRAFCQKLRQTLRYLDASDADMEKGQMRCEVNLSLYPEGADRLSGTKVEVKNLNSFKTVERAIDFEIKRQTEALDAGQKVIQETRGWDEARGETISQRKKESAHDYRYFPEPDIPPFDFSEEYIAGLRRTLPELPDAKAERFANEYQLPAADVVILTEEKEFSAYFEEVASELADKKASGEMQAEIPRAVKLAANYMLTEIRKHLSERGEKTKDIPFTPENYAEFISLIADKKINSSAAQSVLAEMYQGGDNDPSHIVSRLNLAQVSDTGELEGVVDGILAANAKSVADFQAGKENAFQYLIGQVMKETKGKANPEVVATLLRTKLSN